jgi:bifunctional DNA-binding transcriptional regulator/antitoxin component of YhaV-PrlF toxin-antitoxin module
MSESRFAEELMTAEQLSVFEERTALVALYKITVMGQMTLPVTARRYWGLEGSDTVEVMNIDGIGVVTQNESEKRPKIIEAMRAGVDVSKRKVSIAGQFTPPSLLRQAWDLNAADSHVEVVDTVDEVLIMKMGRIASAVEGLLPMMASKQRERLVCDIFARDKSLIRLYGASRLIHEAFPLIYAE